MIATSLFIIIVTASMDALLNANLLHEKSRNMRSIMDNLSFVMEDISRNSRTGYNYHCFAAGDTIPSITSNIVSTPNSCANGWAIAFESANGVPSNDGISDAKDNDQWVYYISNGKLFRSMTGPYRASNFIQLTPDEVVIDSISSFSVLGAESFSHGNRQQPFITLRLVGNIILKNVVTPFSLQTSVSQRLIDI